MFGKKSNTAKRFKQHYIFIILLFFIVPSCNNKESLAQDTAAAHKEFKSDSINPEITDPNELFKDLPVQPLPYKDTLNWDADSKKALPEKAVQQLKIKETVGRRNNYNTDNSKFYPLYKLQPDTIFNYLVICWKWSDNQMFNYLIVYDKNWKVISDHCLSDDEIAESAFHSYSLVDKDKIETHDFNFFERSETVTTLELTKNGLIKELNQVKNIREVFSCDYYNENSSLGIGILIPPQIFEIYNDSLLKDLYVKWSLNEDWNPPKKACSIYYKPDYGITHYVCLESSDKYYKILINSNEIKFCPKKSGYKFEDWEKYISRSIQGVDLKEDKGGSFQTLKKEPRESSETVEKIGRICPGEIKGDWLQVYFCYPQNETISGTAWIKWRDGNKILISIHQLM